MIPKNVVVVLVAHGSRKPEANLEVHQLAEKLEVQAGRPVQACFLELGEPSIPEGIDLALKKSPKEIWVLPYFLVQGRHVQEDLPKILEAKARAYPETPIKILNYLGAQEQMAEWLAQSLES